VNTLAFLRFVLGSMTNTRRDSKRPNGQDWAILVGNVGVRQLYTRRTGGQDFSSRGNLVPRLVAERYAFLACGCAETGRCGKTAKFFISRQRNILHSEDE
jgi:hypothetical protein